MKTAMIALALALVSGAAFSETIQIPKDYATIQAAIDAASDGALLLVAPGTYRERIDFKGKKITLSSCNGPDVTVIDGGGKGSVVTFRRWEGADSVLDGFTLTNGSGTDLIGAELPGTNERITVGGAVYCHPYTSPTLKRNIFANNRSTQGGGAVFCGIQSAPVIHDNRFLHNRSGSGGAILCADRSAPSIKNNVFFDNQAERGSAIFIHDTSRAVITDNLLAEPPVEGEDQGEEIEGGRRGATISGNTYGCG